MPNRYEPTPERIVFVNPGAAPNELATAVDPLVPPALLPYELRSALVIEDPPTTQARTPDDLFRAVRLIAPVPDGTVVTFSLNAQLTVLAIGHKPLSRDSALHSLRFVLLSGGTAIALLGLRTPPEEFAQVATGVFLASEMISLRFIDALSYRDGQITSLLDLFVQTR